MAHVIDYEHGICAVDSLFGKPLFDAIHLVVERGRVAVIDTATNHAVPEVLAALAAKGLSREAVDWVILTHIHLDHAGGAGELMKALPNAKLAVHPRGARHMIDPSRLIAGTVEVYGAEETRRMYGDIVPVPPGRVVDLPDGHVIPLAGRDLVCLDTPGHARHHVCIHDTRSGHVFAGDTFGMAYSELAFDGHRYVFLTTSPTQFDPEAEHRSLDRIMSLRPDAVYVTHFSEVRELDRMASDLHRLVDAHAALAMGLRDAGPERHQRLREGVEALALAEAERYRWPLTRAQLLDIFALDIELNAQGLACWLDSLAGRA